MPSLTDGAEGWLRRVTVSLLDEWPVVGRVEELDLVLDQLRRGRSVVIGGAPGVGKTRLAREALSAGGNVVGSVTATRSAASTPLGALLGLLVDVESTEGADRSQLFRRVRDGLRAGIGEGADGDVALLGVDDGHLLDEVSAAFLLQLAQQGEVQVVVTVRTGEEGPDAITALWRDEIAERVELQPLGRDDVQALLRAALPGAADDGTAHRVWTTTGGNPLYLRELARAALDVGDLRLDGSRWRWEGRRMPVGVRLRELLARSFSDLSPTQRSVLELLALGEPLAVDALLDEVGADAVAACEQRGLVTTSSEATPSLRLHHPLLGEVLRTDLTIAQRQRLTSRLIALSARFPVDPLLVAQWHLDAGLDADPDLLIDAADLALRRFDATVAARLAGAAVDASGGTRACTTLARALIADERYEEAEHLLEPLERSLDDEADTVAVARLLSDVRFWGLGRPDDAEAALVRVGDAIVDPTLRLHVLALRASIRNDVGDILGALALTDWATDADVDVGARLQGVTSAASALTHSGRPGDALQMCDELLPVALTRAEQNPRDVGRVLGQRVHALVALGRLDDAQDVISFVHDLASRDGDDEVQGGTALVLGQLSLERGEVDVAREWLAEAATVLGRFDPQHYLPWCRGLQAWAAALSGHSEEADEAAEEAAALGHAAPVHVFEIHVHLARAHAAAAAGARGRAGDIAMDTADRAAARGDRYGAAVALNAAVDFGAPPGPITERLDALSNATEIPWIDLWRDHARAVAERDGEALEAVAARFGDLGVHLRAARAYGGAARAYAEEGRRSSATRARGRASQHLGRCGGVALPDPNTTSPGVRLTRREAEIAALAARGLTNQEIASRLGVGVRAVEGHLLRATTKLGVHGRNELATVLDDGGEFA
ncbi:MAG: hypothetical protein JNK12_24885 [Acidimicrobiales bacterium]|nr:hypothetical protein [Acidimicrobiales bacterium]